MSSEIIEELIAHSVLKAQTKAAFADPTDGMCDVLSHLEAEANAQAAMEAKHGFTNYYRPASETPITREVEVDSAVVELDFDQQ